MTAIEKKVDTGLTTVASPLFVMTHSKHLGTEGTAGVLVEECCPSLLLYRILGVQQCVSFSYLSFHVQNIFSW